MRVLILLTLFALAGCQEPQGEANFPYDNPQTSSADQSLTVRASADLNRQRDVDVMVYLDGQLRDILSYSATPDSSPEVLRVIETEEADVRLRLVDDGETRLDFTFKPSECPDRSMEVEIRIEQSTQEYLYGCLNR